jgi:formamidopyrimidine-DNA glycosylase
MPELPEVEVLVRHLAPLVKNKIIRGVRVHRQKVIAPTSVRTLKQTLAGAKFTGLSRRGKYLRFTLRARHRRAPLVLVGHLGMAGRLYLQPANQALPRHVAVSLQLGRQLLVYEDTRYFGRLTLATDSLTRLGPEPLSRDFTVDHLVRALKRSAQPVKVKLLDQSLVAGIGNIYASEILFRAGISPRLPARKLTRAQVKRLWRSTRVVLDEAIRCGSTIPLTFGGNRRRDGLFYFGRAPGAPDYYEERLRVYGRAGELCSRCGDIIQRLTQGARSTFYCPGCQRN